jgi:hypothetical protein
MNPPPLRYGATGTDVRRYSVEKSHPVVSTLYPGIPASIRGYLVGCRVKE